MYRYKFITPPPKSPPSMAGENEVIALKNIFEAK